MVNIHFLKSLRISSKPTGFTLIELMITTAIISVLMSLFVGGYINVRDRAKIQFCQNNLREIGMALDRYTQRNEAWLLPTTGPEDDNLSPLYPDYVDSLNIFACMSTANEVKTLQDLKDNAPGGRTASLGHSYEMLSYYLFDRRRNVLVNPIQKSRSSVDTQAGRIWLVMDAMETATPNYPDESDNHRAAGGNVLFADGHVEWIPGVTWGLEFTMGNSR